MESDASIHEMLEKYVEQARAAGQTLADAIGHGDLEAVRRTCLDVKGTAGGYGFEALGGAASEALQALEGTPNRDGPRPGDPDAAAPLREATIQLRRLRLLCEHVAVRGAKPDKSNASNPPPPPA